YRPMTTVDQTTHFMRAATAADVLADARVVRLGRTMSFGRVTLLSDLDKKPVAMVSSAFAMLGGEHSSCPALCEAHDEFQRTSCPRICSAAFTMLIEGLAPQ